MKEITTRKILNILTICIVILVPFMKQLSYYLTYFGILEHYDCLNPAVVLYMAIPVLIGIYIIDLFKHRRKIDIYDYLFYILVIVGIISTMFSINMEISIFGKEFRHEGFLAILSYYLLFINWKVNGTKKSIKNFINLILFLSIVNSIYALFQIYTPFDFILRYTADPDMASGLCGNPNFFGSLIITAISMITCNFLMNKKMSISNIFIIILLFISLINSQSTGPFITYIILLVILPIFLYKKKCLVPRKIIILLCVLVLTYSSVYIINKNLYSSSRCEMCDINKTIKNGGNGRIEIWVNSLDIVKDNILLGVGFDNFHLAYPNPEVDSSVTITLTGDKIKQSGQKTFYMVDNAHNVYLHILITNGLLGLIPYLALCLLTFIRGLKSNSKVILILLSGFVSYSIQAFGNISVIQVAPIYFIIIGLILSEK